MKRILLVGMGLGLAGLSCQQGPLSGSVDALFPLDVSRTEILRNDQAFQVSYYAYHEPDVDIVARVTVALQGLTFVTGRDLPLQGEYSPGHQRTTVVHLAAGEAELVFPNVQTGVLHLDSGGNPGQVTRGTFGLSFVQSASEGGGRTLNGAFSGPALDAGYGPGT